MIRGLAGTILWTCLAGAVGVGLFFVKHEVKDLEGRLAGIDQDIQRNQQEIHVLRAEWAYLNDPARLRELAEKHLGMRPINANQVVANLDSLPVAGGPPAFASLPANRIEPQDVADAGPAAATVARAEPNRPESHPVAMIRPAPLPAPRPRHARPAGAHQLAAASRSIGLRRLAAAGDLDPTAGEER